MKEKLTIEQILTAMKPIPGETRQICQCNYCQQYFGRRFIPHGLGHGLTIQPCPCDITNNQHGNYTTIQEHNP